MITYIKPIKNHPCYLLSEYGDIYSLKTNKILKPGCDPEGYPIVVLQNKNKKWESKRIHRLLLTAFVGECPKGAESLHKNGNPHDNRLSNLKWGTHTENMRDKKKHGTNNYALGEAASRAKLRERDVRMIVYIYRTKLFTQQEVADMYSISKRTVFSILSKETWRHLWKKK